MYVDFQRTKINLLAESLKYGTIKTFKFIKSYILLLEIYKRIPIIIGILYICYRFL